MNDAIDIPTRTLVHAMVRADGTIDAGELYTVATALGMTVQQVRLCVARLVREGRFTQEGRGRRATLRSTDVTRRTLTPNVEFVRLAYRQDRGAASWDGLWHLVAFAVPETERRARDALREAIWRLGGAAIQGGLYVSPNAWEPLVEDAARRLDVLDAVTFAATVTLRVGAVDDPRRLAAHLWPLDEIAARYERLTRLTGQRLERLAQPGEHSPTQDLVITMELIAEFTRAMEPDPLLPPELLPHPWPGVEARALAIEAWRRLGERAEPTTTPRLFQAYADVVAAKSTSRSVTRSGDSTCGQWPIPGSDA